MDIMTIIGSSSSQFSSIRHRTRPTRQSACRCSVMDRATRLRQNRPAKETWVEELFLNFPAQYTQVKSQLERHFFYASAVRKT
jgi:hypothetical protein